MKNTIYFLIFPALSFLFSCTANEPRGEEPAGPPNFILIMADDLGYGDLSCYSNERIQTPHIDRLAAEGLKLLDFHSNGAVCSPTRAALMTGKYQQRTGVEGVITAAGHREVGLNLEEVTLAEELKKQGYACGIFGKWHLGYAPEFNPVRQGFDEFVGFVSGNVDYHAHIDQEAYLDWWRDTTIQNEEGYTTDLITQYGVDFIQAHQDEPFFLYLPHEAPHYPYQRRVDEPVRAVGVKNLREVPADSIPDIYREMVEVMDEGIGRIMQTLRATGLDQNTIVLFCSDNGANGRGNNGALRGTKGRVYEGGHRVPAIVWYPTGIKGGATSDEPILSMDILPTFLDFVDVEPSASDVDGISFKNLLLHGEPLPERDLFWSFRQRHAVRSGDWKLVVTGTEEGERMELFNLSEDLSEQTDLIEQYPEEARQLREKLRVWGLAVRDGVAVVAK